MKPADTAPKASSPVAAGLPCRIYCCIWWVSFSTCPLSRPVTPFSTAPRWRWPPWQRGWARELFWRKLGRYPRHRVTIFIVGLALVFALVTILAVVGETYIERSISLYNSAVCDSIGSDVCSHHCVDALQVHIAVVVGHPDCSHSVGCRIGSGGPRRSRRWKVGAAAPGFSRGVPASGRR